MNMRLCWTLGSCLLSGCAATSPQTSAVTATTAVAATSPAAQREAREAPGALVLQVVLRAPNGDAARTLSQREALPTGARIALWVTAEGGALWLYAYHRGPEGKLEALNQTPEHIASGALVALPGEGLWYRLEGAAGNETFYTIAARAVLSPQRLAALLAALPQEREPPVSSTSHRFPGPSYRRLLDEGGLATLAFTLRHDETAAGSQAAPVP